MCEGMRAGRLYIVQGEQIECLRKQAAERTGHYSTLGVVSPETRMAVLREMPVFVGEGMTVCPPAYIDYGVHARIGAGISLNYDCVLLDMTDITIGEYCQLTPEVQLLTAWHPLETESRRADWESGTPIVIGDGVWLGANALVLSGVTIGDNIVVGAGSMVTRDLPANAAALGSPIQVHRGLPGYVEQALLQ